MSLQAFVREHGFDHIEQRLRSRFSANDIDFSCEYSESLRNPASLCVELKNDFAEIQLCLWENGGLDLLSIQSNDPDCPNSSSVQIASEDQFHEALVSCFLSLRNRQAVEMLDSP